MPEKDAHTVQAEDLRRAVVEEEEVGRREFGDDPGEGTVLAEDLGCSGHLAGEADSGLEAGIGREEDTVPVEEDSGHPEEGGTVRNLVEEAVL